MKGLILAGGFATRLRPLSCSKPKLLFPMVGVPLIDHMVDWLAGGNVKDMILAVNHLSDKLRIEVAARKLENRIVLSVEDTPLGTGGPIRLAAPMLNTGEPLVVVNGDIVSNIDLKGIVADHVRSGAEATVALVSVRDTRPFGLATVNSSDQIVGFVEKSQTNVGPGWVNAGVYVLNPSVVKMIPRGGAVSLEREIFPVLAKRIRLRGWRHKGFWYDIGKIHDYVVANRKLLEKPGDFNVKKSMRVDSRVEVKEPSYLSDHCKIETETRLGPYTIMSPRVTVKTRSVVRNTIIFEETTIGAHCLVEDSVIGEAATIGSGVKIGKGSLVAGEVVIPDNTTVNPGSVVLN